VTLDAMYVEGWCTSPSWVAILPFDEARQELRGERTGIRYAIGTRVRVQVSRVDLDGRKIDFRLVRENEELLGRALRDKGVVPTPAREKVARTLAKRGCRSQGRKSSRKRPLIWSLRGVVARHALPSSRSRLRSSRRLPQENHPGQGPQAPARLNAQQA
jgi:ribonuclease R